MEKIGKVIKNCISCGSKVNNDKELKILVSHKQTGTIMATMYYHPPLCSQCGGKGSLSFDMEWTSSSSG